MLSIALCLAAKLRQALPRSAGTDHTALASIAGGRAHIMEELLGGCESKSRRTYRRMFMSKNISACFLWAAYACASLPAHATELWHGTQSGMSVQQVLTSESGSAPCNPSPCSTLANGAAALIHGPNQPIAGKHFDPQFFFLNGKLNQVTLSIQDAEDDNAASNAFDSLVSAMRSKYGPESSLKNTVIGKEGEWFNGRTNIVLYLIVGLGKPLLNIVYQTRVSSDADHL